MDRRGLWCDLKTDKERIAFLRSGRAWKTGIVAPSVVDDLVEVFEYRDKHKQKVKETKNITI